MRIIWRATSAVTSSRRWWTVLGAVTLGCARPAPGGSSIADASAPSITAPAPRAASGRVQAEDGARPEFAHAPVQQIPAFDASGVTPRDAAEFLAALQTIVRSENWEQLADRVQYPITVRIGSAARHVSGNREFVKNARLIMGQKVVRALLEQQATALFANYRGVMIGDGEIWFGCREDPARAAGACTQADLRVVAINN